MRPTPSMAVAGTALLISLGGTGHAATQLPPRSVGHAQIRNGAVGNLQIRDKAITTGKVRDGAITGAKLRDGAVGAKDLAKGVVPLPQASLQQTSGEAVAPGAIIARTAIGQGTYSRARGDACGMPGALQRGSMKRIVVAVRLAACIGAQPPRPPCATGA